jgi:GT2 family glycosyltransferase
MHANEHMGVADRAFMTIMHLMIYMSWIAGVPPSVGDFILTTRENHLRVKGFVEGAIMGEDIDYGLRSVKAGAKKRFYFSPRVVASGRRLQKIGRVHLYLLWSKAFLHVRRHGPIFAEEGFVYPFGEYGRRK